MVEHQPSKLGVVGSSPITRSSFSGASGSLDHLVRRIFCLIAKQ
jgi:hypothetical protein